MVRNRRIGDLYGRERETSVSVREDVFRGEVFSSSRFTRKVWADFCEANNVTAEHAIAVENANDRIRRLYLDRGLVIQTLEDK